MQFKNIVGQKTTIDDGMTMNIIASGAINYGDIVTITGATEVAGQPYLVGKQSQADSIAILGVCCEPGGIATGGIGRIQIAGIADVNVASATYTTPGALIVTNGGGNGSGAAGTPAAGKSVGLAIGDVSGTVTQTKVLIRLSDR
jgi:hypothetical protein